MSLDTSASMPFLSLSCQQQETRLQWLDQRLLAGGLTEAGGVRSQGTSSLKG